MPKYMKIKTWCIACVLNVKLVPVLPLSSVLVVVHSERANLPVFLPCFLLLYVFSGLFLVVIFYFYAHTCVFICACAYVHLFLSVSTMYGCN